MDIVTLLKMKERDEHAELMKLLEDKANVSSTSLVNFFASGLGLLCAGCPGCLAFFLVENFRKSSSLL